MDKQTKKILVRYYEDEVDKELGITNVIYCSEDDYKKIKVDDDIIVTSRTKRFQYAAVISLYEKPENLLENIPIIDSGEELIAIVNDENRKNKRHLKEKEEELEEINEILSSKLLVYVAFNIENNEVNELKEKAKILISDITEIKKKLN